MEVILLENLAVIGNRIAIWCVNVECQKQYDSYRKDKTSIKHRTKTNNKKQVWIWYKPCDALISGKKIGRTYLWWNTIRKSLGSWDVMWFIRISYTRICSLVLRGRYISISDKHTHSCTQNTHSRTPPTQCENHYWFIEI